MKVTYLAHSGFMLETATADFIFDYEKGVLPARKADKPLVVMVSHKHPDHYNPVIFTWIKQYPNIQYVVSRDVPVKWKIAELKVQGTDLSERVTVVRKNTEQELILSNGKSLKLATLKSTDEGVAYLLEYEGKTIYHAGDLNLWVWEGESKQYNDNMTRAYFKELEKMKGRKIDIAFVPLDKRQEKSAFLGMESFLQYTESKVVFPMHFWERYEITDEFLIKHPEYEDRIKRITAKGQSFEIK